ncbi:hypothetical protein PRIPAC_82290 [Pristionchus pacificus]|uniref:Uncharacterized protein n=1 Tax=Pristionchus pacificus TaxID=54126 RepID=A0A2A6CPH0_PRIPA|nr:hypothetical protein PRIPAC_82290 [Pristionchus pacificus]|eukprot:PDM80102.1 hypothetical protein PRIPAC_32681 [Pristionchus pacificus]
MSMVFLHWQISRFLQAQQAAATVPSDIQALFDRSDVHVTQRVMTLEKIARLTEGGVDNLAVRYFPCILSNFFFQYLEKGVTNHKTEVIARFVHTDDNIDGVTKNITRLVIGDHHELSDKASIATRPHLIVIGDTVDNLEKELGKEKFVTLRIGFLNGPVEKLPKFLSCFDMIVTDKQAAVDVPRRIINAIVEKKIAKD